MSYLVATKTKFLASNYRAFRVWIEVPDAETLAVGETFDEKIDLGHRCIVPERRFPEMAPIDLEKTNGQRPNHQSAGTEPSAAAAGAETDAPAEAEDLQRDGGQPAGPAGDETGPGGA